MAATLVARPGAAEPEGRAAERIDTPLASAAARPQADKPGRGQRKPANASDRSAARPPVNRVRDAPQAAVTLDDAVAIVRQHYGGRIVQSARLGDAASTSRGARYRIRVDINGRVKTVFVDHAGRIHEPRPRNRDARADR